MGMNPHHGRAHLSTSTPSLPMSAIRDAGPMQSLPSPFSGMNPPAGGYMPEQELYGGGGGYHDLPVARNPAHYPSALVEYVAGALAQMPAQYAAVPTLVLEEAARSVARFESAQRNPGYGYGGG